MAQSGNPGQTFATGDVVRHPRRPEWGSGVVRSATRVTHEGTPAQRLTVRFANKGPVTINTAVAPLSVDLDARGNTNGQTVSATRQSNASNPSPARQEAQVKPMNTTRLSAKESRTPSPGAGGWLGELERRGTGSQQSHELWDLPEHLSDPFASDEARLLATLETYKYSTDARPLMDWAVAQTGLNDPLTRYTRVELEEAFPRYARNRDMHLKLLVNQLQRNEGEEVIRGVRRQLKNPAAISALDKSLNR